MKKCITLLLTITLALYHPTAASAAVPTDATIVETFEDGSYIETVIEEATSASSASKSGATAKATVSAKRYADGTYIRTMTQSVSLTCSKNGTLS